MRKKPRPHQSNGFEILAMYFPHLRENAGFRRAFKKHFFSWQLPLTENKSLLDFADVARKPKLKKKMELAIVEMGIVLYKKKMSSYDPVIFGDVFREYYGINLDRLIARHNFFRTSSKKSPYGIFIGRILMNLW